MRPPVARRELLLAPGVPTLVLAALVGRLPMGMIGLSTVTLLVDSGHGYGAAGGIVGAYTLCCAGFAPAVARLIDRRGQTAVLIGTGVIWPAALVLVIILAEGGARLWLLLLCAGFAGLAFPPVQACLRTVWPALVSDLPRGRERAYSLDAALQELTYLGGPVAVGFFIVIGSPALAVAATAAAGSVGTLLFAATRASREHPVQRQHRADHGPMRLRGIRTVVGSFLGVGGMWGGLAVVLTAIGNDAGTPALASAGMASYALGSILGGIWAANRPASHGPGRRYIVALFAGTLFLAPLVLLQGFGQVLVVLFIAGIPLAPAMGAAYALVGELSPEAMATESFTWLTSAAFAGGAAGSALCGIAIQHVGAAAGAGLLVAFSAAALATTALGARRLPRVATQAA